MTMKAVQLQTTGGPEVLSLVDLPLPQPSAGQVRVKAHAIGAGGPDVLIRNGTYKWMPPLPAIPGNELAGIVDAVGPGVSRLSIGDRVLVSARELPQRGAAMRRPSALRSRFRSYFQTPLPSMMQ
jgi:NADPH2:quinone reductase